ncbi:uncharacterized protein MCYG_07333 [Microsporum canis CBS 113480]|uniref:Uncharacterized protein n=1 Tax=Arthroderma otae (strain ATCC MYA-4605 / CBS 113480) TaxID=554155 RepID=C5FYB6_ARTOC|nr:uncharacterized protein MCYG_07333 [Microsporum canis CBS 113480]EEQ34514.1 predicted protein [Microsporum canis CBS 113480]
MPQQGIKNHETIGRCPFEHVIETFLDERIAMWMYSNSLVEWPEMEDMLRDEGLKPERPHGIACGTAEQHSLILRGSSQLRPKGALCQNSGRHGMHYLAHLCIAIPEIIKRDAVNMRLFR